MDLAVRGTRTLPQPPAPAAQSGKLIESKSENGVPPFPAPLVPLLLLVLLLAAFPALLGAQQGQEGPRGDGWNDPEVLALVEMARETRRDTERAAELESWTARTDGHIYFYVDPDDGRRALIRVDQVAVDVFWEAPDRTRQRVIGERTETFLPVRDFDYYLDRLTLVQSGFGDEIRVGHGMDVADVPHPLRWLPPGTDQDPIYDVRLADALTLTLPGVEEPLRILQVEVRPRDASRPAMVGSVFLAERDGSLVRMELGFTPASYVDRRTDRVSVELDFGLWEGRHWLPNEQVLEVRREVPELDLGVGTVIRAVLRVGNYDLGAPVPPEVMAGPPVQAAPQLQRESFEFSEGLLDALQRDGLSGADLQADPADLRAEALGRGLQGRPPSGLAPLRLHLPRVSSLLTHDRTRGWEPAVGVTLRPSSVLRIRATGGWAPSADRVRGDLVLDGPGLGAWSMGARLSANGVQDLGVRPAGPPLLATASSLLFGEDWADPYRSSGALLTAARRTDSGARIHLAAGVEWHRSEELGGDDESLRPVLPVEEGTRGRLRGLAALPAPGLPDGWDGELVLDSDLLLGAGVGGRVQVELDVGRRDPAGRSEVRGRLLAGGAPGSPSPQLLGTLGGRNTLPGWPMRSFGGSGWSLASVEGSRQVGTPHLHLRGGIHGGWAGGDLPGGWSAPDGGGPRGTRGVRGGITAGVGTLWNLVHIDAARGLGGGEWQLLLSVDPTWWDRL